MSKGCFLRLGFSATGQVARCIDRFHGSREFCSAQVLPMKVVWPLIAELIKRSFARDPWHPKLSDSPRKRIDSIELAWFLEQTNWFIFAFKSTWHGFWGKPIGVFLLASQRSGLPHAARPTRVCF